MLKDVFKNLKQHCMSGISYMIPVISPRIMRGTPIPTGPNS